MQPIQFRILTIVASAVLLHGCVSQVVVTPVTDSTKLEEQGVFYQSVAELPEFRPRRTL